VIWQLYVRDIFVRWFIRHTGFSHPLHAWPRMFFYSLDFSWDEIFKLIF